MDFAIEGFTLTLIVALAAMAILAVVLRLAQFGRDRRLMRRIEEDLDVMAVPRRALRPARAAV